MAAAAQTQTTAELVAFIQRFAAEHYEGPDGWSVIVECYSTDDIAALLKHTHTWRGALRVMSPFVRRWNEQQREANVWREPQEVW